MRRLRNSRVPSPTAGVFRRVSGHLLGRLQPHRPLKPRLRAGLSHEILLPGQRSGLPQARPALNPGGGNNPGVLLLVGQPLAIAPGERGGPESRPRAHLARRATVPRHNIPATTLFIPPDVIDPHAPSTALENRRLIHTLSLAPGGNAGPATTEPSLPNTTGIYPATLDRMTDFVKLDLPPNLADWGERAPPPKAGGPCHAATRDDNLGSAKHPGQSPDNLPEARPGLLSEPGDAACRELCRTNLIERGRGRTSGPRCRADA